MGKKVEMLHLSSKIRTNLQYKAWAEGILVLENGIDGLKDKHDNK